MANTQLTDDKITKKALAILHSKAQFIGTINRQYDSSFGVEGGKIGSTLRIRMPVQYSVRTGSAIDVQASTETSQTLTVATQKGVDMDFSSAELKMDIDDFSARYLEPAMGVLAANLEADAFTMYKDVYNVAGTVGTVPNDIAMFLGAKTKMNQSLAPLDGKRYAMVNSATSAALVGGLKSVFHASSQIEKQYLQGKMGTMAGFDFYENELCPSHTNGAVTALSALTVNGSSQTGATVSLNCTNGDILTKGTVFTMAGCYKVHPETKANMGVLQQFVVTTTTTATGTTVTVPISPSITTSGATQNVSASPTASQAITIVTNLASTTTAGTTYANDLCYHSDAFTFVTAPLPIPQGMDMAKQLTYDGLSLRFVRGYDISSDRFVSRFDVLYGHKAIRPEWACRVTS